MENGPLPRERRELVPKERGTEDRLWQGPERQARTPRVLGGTGALVAPEELGLDGVAQRGGGQAQALRTAAGVCALPNLSPPTGSWA